MSPFITFRNKYEFYGELAVIANKTLIASHQEYNDKDIFVAVLSKVESFRKERLPELNDYFDREKTLLDEAESWISTNRKVDHT